MDNEELPEYLQQEKAAEADASELADRFKALIEKHHDLIRSAGAWAIGWLHINKHEPETATPEPEDIPVEATYRQEFLLIQILEEMREIKKALKGGLDKRQDGK